MAREGSMWGRMKEEGGDSETLSNVSVALTTVYIGTKVSCCFLRELGGCRARVMC